MESSSNDFLNFDPALASSSQQHSVALMTYDESLGIMVPISSGSGFLDVQMSEEFQTSSVTYSMQASAAVNPGATDATTAAAAPKKKVKKSKEGSEKTDSLDRKKKKEHRDRSTETASYSLSKHILETGGESENSSKWVASNSKNLSKLFSTPVEVIDLPSPTGMDIALSPAMESTLNLPPTPGSDFPDGTGVSLKSKRSIKKSSSSAPSPNPDQLLSPSSSSSSTSSKSHRHSKQSSSTSLTSASDPQQRPAEQYGQPPQFHQVQQQQQYLHLPVPQFTAAQGTMFFPPTASQHAKALHPAASHKTLARSNSNSSISSLSSLSSVSSIASTNSMASTSSMGEESRRQLHIELEQSRRRNIKDSLEELKNNIPSCEGQKLSKALILSKAIAYVQQVKRQKENLQAQVHALKVQLAYFQSHCNCAGNAAFDPSFLASLPMPPSGPYPGFTPVGFPAGKAMEYQHIQPKHEVVTPGGGGTRPRPSSSRSRTLSAGASSLPPQTPDPSTAYHHPHKPSTIQTPSKGHFTSAFDNSQIFRGPGSPASSIDEDFDARSFTEEPEISPLPQGWEEQMTPDGKSFFVNKPLNLTSWVDPRSNSALKSALRSPKSPQHPPPSNEGEWSSFLSEDLLPGLSEMRVDSVDGTTGHSHQLQYRPGLGRNGV